MLQFAADHPRPFVEAEESCANSSLTGPERFFLVLTRCLRWAIQEEF